MRRDSACDDDLDMEALETGTFSCNLFDMFRFGALRDVLKSGKYLFQRWPQECRSDRQEDVWELAVNFGNSCFDLGLWFHSESSHSGYQGPF